MFKRKKQEPQATWTSSSINVPAPPKPVQFTARQLAYIHSVLDGQAMMATLSKVDDESIKVIKGALSAVQSSLRDWWSTTEPLVQTCTVSFTTAGSSGSETET